MLVLKRKQFSSDSEEEKKEKNIAGRAGSMGLVAGGSLALATDTGYDALYELSEARRQRKLAKELLDSAKSKRLQSDHYPNFRVIDRSMRKVLRNGAVTDIKLGKISKESAKEHLKKAKRAAIPALAFTGLTAANVAGIKKLQKKEAEENKKEK